MESKSKNQLVEDLSNKSAPFIEFEHLKMAIFVRCIEDLEKSLKSLDDSMNSNATSSNNLATKVMYLNIVLAVATVIGTIFTIYNLFYP